MVSPSTQSREVDIKPTVLGILYAQLELHFKLFRAAGTIYDKYKYTITNPNVVLNDASPTARAILKASVKLTKWTHVALDDLAKSTGILRVDLVRKMDEWNERGLIRLEKEGVQHIFRLERTLPSSPQEINNIIMELDHNMESTEQQNLARTQALVHLITAKRCFSRAIAGYFGEDGGESNDCGHCTWCETHVQVVLPNEPAQAPDQVKVQKILDKVMVRDDPRFLAKVAFGIKSPRITALKVLQTGVFESMNVCEFPELLRLFTKACAG